MTMESTTSLVHRILRLLAWVGLAYGCARMILSLVGLLSPGFGEYWQFTPMAPISRAIGLLGAVLGYVATVLLIAGAIGLLNWKGWSRSVLIVWAFLQLASTAGMMFASYGFYMYVRRSTTQPGFPPLAAQMLAAAMRAVIDFSFPLAMLGVMFQREVKDLWAQPRRGGFEVIPMAKAAEPTGDASRLPPEEY